MPIPAGVLLAKTLVLKAQTKSAAVHESAMLELQVRLLYNMNTFMGSCLLPDTNHLKSYHSLWVQWSECGQCVHTPTG